MDPHKYCANKTYKSGTSFYYSFLFLPPKEKQAIMAVYAFCREVDDIVDNYTDKEIAKVKLNWWHTEINKIFNGEPQHPVGKALLDVLNNFSLKKHLFQEILQGMQMDLEYQGYQSFDDLKLYCHCVASTVGMLSAEIFSYKNQQTLKYAQNLGLAFQLVNIIRDVGEDARLSRIYIPEQELSEFSIDPQDILQKKVINSNNFQNLMRIQAQRARSYYNKALEILPPCDRFKQRSGIIMAKIYFTILEEIEATNFKILDQKITITPIRKLWIAWKTYRQEKNLYALS